MTVTAGSDSAHMPSIRPRAPRFAVLAIGIALSGCATPSGPVAENSANPASPATVPSASITPSPAAPSATGAEPSASPCAPTDPIDCRLEAIADAASQGTFDGVFLIARDGKAIWHRAFGMNASGKPMQVEDRLGIQSAGKMFTAIAIAQLVEDGKLRFADSAGKYVSGLPPDVSKATVHQLLSHTSGIGMMSWGGGLSFEPGAFNYSNAGFNLLAHIVEHVADQTFADYLDREVFERAGMTGTASDGTQPRGAPIGAGGQASTTDDLLRFANSLFDYRLLSKAMTIQITSKKVDIESGGYAYGFGIFAGENDEVDSVGHIGISVGNVSAVEMNPTLGYTVIVLSNRGWADIEPALDDFQRSIGMGYWRES
jgi:CubicO group peptidase (beta-lactamase class C family)